jgi:ATP-dependent protease HslVU (ClpYQ) ATPase subunit
MTEVNSAESYYQYRIESDAKLAELTATSNRLNKEITQMRLQTSIEKYVAKIGANDEVSQFLFNQLKDTDTDIQSVPESVNSIRENESLQRFFAKIETPQTQPKRVFNQGW